MQQQEDKLIKAKVKIVRILFPKSNQADSDFKIVSVAPVEVEEGDVVLNSWGNFVIKGNIPEVNMLDTYTIIAREIYDEKWGTQYELLYFGTPMDFENVDHQRIFLSKILTETQFKNLYEMYGNPFEIIQSEDVEKLTKVKGIGTKTAIKIIEKYKNSIDYSEAYVKLDGYGLTTTMINKLIEKYGSPNLVIKKVTENPYILADEIDGIGFKKADAIALNSGIPKDSPFRIEAFIKSYLNQMALEGHSYVCPQKDLMKEIEENLGEIDREIIKQVIVKMGKEKILWWSKDKDKIGLYKYFKLEKEIAKELIRLLKAENKFKYDNWEQIIKETEKKQGWNFTEQQLEGIKTVLENNVVMITGYGGTGKSSIVAGMLDILYRTYDYSFAQCALAGKASARLAEVTGEKGYTIHRLLRYNPITKQFDYDKEYQLPYDIVIVDELSMVGGRLFYDLIQAIQTGSKLIMLCDIGQLESIGMGNIAKDIIDSGVIPTVRLTQIHRQAQKSAIVTESLKVRKSQHIIKSNFLGTEVRGELKDLKLDIYSDKDMTADKIIQYFNEELPNVDSIMDIQVVVPMKNRGSACTFTLNEKLQEIYNPFSYEKSQVKIKVDKNKFYILREGDKIINTKNNYKTYDVEGNFMPIFNGNTGVIKEINLHEGIMIIDFQHIGEIIIPKSFWKAIELGYAITSHKSQGSEYHTVIVGLDFSSYTLLTREWVYTSITRAKKRCILVAQNRALRYAVEHSNVITKRTFLKDFLNILENTFDKI